MNRFYCYLCICLVAIYSATGCKKKEQEELRDYRFELIAGSPTVRLHVLLYDNEEDRTYFRNPVDSGVTDANGIYIVPAAKLVKGNTYYADIYSADFSYSEYLSFVYADNNSFSNYGFKHTFTTPNGGYRRFYIDGRKLFTSWKAVDAREPGVGSVWNSIPAADQLRGIRFNCDGAAVYTEKDAMLNDLVTNFNYERGFQNTIGGIGLLNAFPRTVDTTELVDMRNGLRYYFIKE